MPTNLSGGLKARGHPIGGTGLFQICENYLQITERFPNRDAQVRGARFGISNSIGGPGNNNYVTLIERADGRRRRDEVPEPRRMFESRESRRERERAHALHGREARVEAVTTIHVTGAAAIRSTSRCSRSTGGACSRSSISAPSESAPSRAGARGPDGEVPGQGRRRPLLPDPARARPGARPRRAGDPAARRR
jgi:hypothetical protein